MNAELTAELRYSPALARRVAFAYVRRGLGLFSWFVIAAVVVVAARAVVLQPRSWSAGVVFGIAAVLVSLVAAAILLHHQRGMAALRRMGEPRAQLRVSDAGLSVSSAAGSFSAPWEIFTELWRFPDFWLLIFGRGQFITLPLADLGEDVQALIAAKIAKP